MNSSSTPICIAGMHRCGTSLVASLLSKAGLSLGSTNDLLPPNDSNALGYFEHQDIVYDINEALLRSFGGSWKSPPELPNDWLHHAHVNAIREKAEQVCINLSKSQYWGWKDPRTSLVMPFWQSLVPDAGYIICLRNPLDVAASLATRDQIPIEQASQLWEQYCRSALENTHQNNRLVLFYEDFFTHPSTQTQRLLRFSKTAPQQNSSTLISSVHSRLRHHTSSLEEIEQSELTSSCIDLYKNIYQEFGLKGVCEDKNPSDDPQDQMEPSYTSELLNTKEALPDRALKLPRVENPDVSIIIPTFNNSELLYSTLLSVLLYTDPIYEVIVINDASTDNTASLLEMFENIRVHHNHDNLDFLACANLGASLAKANKVLFLNNDVSVRDGWLQNMLHAFHLDDKNKAVGAKLISMDGTLQEAGAIIWSDASVSLYGAGEDPFASEYNFVRAVDYCSGACLLVDKGTFDSLGGFDSRYAPAYYEDADLCLAINLSGYRVIYQPQAEVFHHHMSSRPTEKVRQLVNKNRQVFLDKWRKELLAAPENSNALSQNYLASNRVGEKRMAIVLNSLEELLTTDENPLFSLIQKLADSGMAVSVTPIKPISSLRLELAHLQNLGVEVFYDPQFDIEKLLISRSGCYDYIYYGQESIHPHIMMLVNNYHAKAKILDQVEIETLAARR